MPDYAELDLNQYVIGVVSSDEPIDLNVDERHLILLQEGWTWVSAPKPTGYVAVLSGNNIVWQDNRPLSQAQSEAYDRVKASQATAIEAAGVTPYGTFQTDPQSLANITSVAVLLFANPGVLTTKFTLADNTRPSFARNDFFTAASMIGLAVQSCYDTAYTLRQSIAACKTNSDADAIAWP